MGWLRKLFRRTHKTPEQLYAKQQGREAAAHDKAIGMGREEAHPPPVH